MPTCRLILADDHDLLVEGLVSILQNQGTFEIVGIASDGLTLKELIGAIDADLLLVDINMPKLNGLEAIKKIHPAHPQLKIIVISTYEEKHIIRRAREFGASGYHLKNAGKEQLFACIQTVLNGREYFPVLEKPFQPATSEVHPLVLLYKLSKREWEILLLLKEEYTNKQVAEKLYLSIYTVETHRKNIMQKLGLKTPTALMKFAIQHQL